MKILYFYFYFVFFIAAFIKGANFNAYNIKEKHMLWGTWVYVQHLRERWSNAFKIPEVKELVNSDEKFDAIIIEDTWMDSFKILGQKYNCPVIVFTSTGGKYITNYISVA